jgi:hypothetical protein
VCHRRGKCVHQETCECPEPYTGYCNETQCTGSYVVIWDKTNEFVGLLDTSCNAILRSTRDVSGISFKTSGDVVFDKKRSYAYHYDDTRKKMIKTELENGNYTQSIMTFTNLKVTGRGFRLFYLSESDTIVLVDTERITHLNPTTQTVKLTHSFGTTVKYSTYRSTTQKDYVYLITDTGFLVEIVIQDSIVINELYNRMNEFEQANVILGLFSASDSGDIYIVSNDTVYYFDRYNKLFKPRRTFLEQFEVYRVQQSEKYIFLFSTFNEILQLPKSSFIETDNTIATIQVLLNPLVNVINDFVPVVQSYTPSFIPMKGGALVTVTGVNLMFGGNAIIQMTAFDNRTAPLTKCIDSNNYCFDSPLYPNREKLHFIVMNMSVGISDVPEYIHRMYPTLNIYRDEVLDIDPTLAIPGQSIIAQVPFVQLGSGLLCNFTSKKTGDSKIVSATYKTTDSVKCIVPKFNDTHNAPVYVEVFNGLVWTESVFAGNYFYYLRPSASSIVISFYSVEQVTQNYESSSSIPMSNGAPDIQLVQLSESQSVIQIESVFDSTESTVVRKALKSVTTHSTLDQQAFLSFSVSQVSRGAMGNAVELWIYSSPTLFVRGTLSIQEKLNVFIVLTYQLDSVSFTAKTLCKFKYDIFYKLIVTISRPTTTKKYWSLISKLEDSDGKEICSTVDNPKQNTVKTQLQELVTTGNMSLVISQSNYIPESSQRSIYSPNNNTLAVYLERTGLECQAEWCDGTAKAYFPPKSIAPYIIAVPAAVGAALLVILIICPIILIIIVVYCVRARRRKNAALVEIEQVNDHYKPKTNGQRQFRTRNPTSYEAFSSLYIEDKPPAYNSLGTRVPSEQRLRSLRRDLESSNSSSDSSNSRPLMHFNSV